MAGGRPTDYSPETITKAKEYLDLCVDTEGDKLKVKIPTIEWLARHLGMSKETVFQWEKEKGKEEFSDFLCDLRAEQAERLINNWLWGRYNPVITKLILSKHGYVEKTENKDTVIVATPEDLQNMTDEELQAFIK